MKKTIRPVLMIVFVIALISVLLFFPPWIYLRQSSDGKDEYYDQITDRILKFKDEINECNGVERCECKFDKDLGANAFIVTIIVNSEMDSEDKAYVFTLRHILYRFATDDLLRQDFMNLGIFFYSIYVFDNNGNEIAYFVNNIYDEYEMILWTSFFNNGTSGLFGYLIDSDGVTIYKNFKWRMSTSVRNTLVPENIVAYYTWDEVFDEEFSREVVMEQIYS